MPVTPLLRPILLTTCALAAALALGGCTKAPTPQVSASATTSVSGSSETSIASPTLVPSTTAPVTTVPPSTTAPVTAPPSTTVPASPTPAPGPAGCVTSALSIDVQRGSGAAGHQFASIVFTNTSPTTCTITGYPGVQLLAGGAPIGSPATRIGQSGSAVRLAPGASASSAVENTSTCNASNSDSVQVIVPNQTQTTVRPLRFRACPLTVAAVVAN